MDVARVKYWSKIDFSDAYEQVHIKPEDILKNAFTTIYGTYASHIMVQGDCNAPSTFQQLMTHASTSWGISFVLNSWWLAWQLLPSWKSDGWDIGWAEMIMVELALRAMIASGFSNCHFTIHSDNAGVIGSINAGTSRNSAQNLILCKIVSLMQSHSIWLTTTWIASADNPADDPSWGIFLSHSLLFLFPPAIPPHLKPFVRPSISFHDPHISQMSNISW
jgi:hypothetical protein